MTMTDSKSPTPVGHTPGPWRRGREGNLRVYGPDSMGELSGLVAGMIRPRDINLIAAAPDLLDACKVAANALAYCVEPATGCDDEQHIADALASLEAAIAKAEGVEP